MWVAIANTDKPITACYIAAYFTAASTAAATGDWLFAWVRGKAEPFHPSNVATHKVPGREVNINDN